MQGIWPFTPHQSQVIGYEILPSQALATMKMLIAAFVLFGCVEWWSALSGIARYSTGTNGTEIAYHATSGSRLFAGAYGTFLFAFAFACYRKVKRTWEIGFGFLAIAWSWSIFYAAPVVLAPGQGGFLALGLIAAASALALLLLGSVVASAEGLLLYPERPGT